MVPQRRAEALHPFDDAEPGAVDVVEAASLDDVEEELAGEGRGYHRGAAVDADQGPELTQELGGEPVVCVHFAFPSRADAGGHRPDAVGELGGGLLGEGQAEDLLGGDAPLGDELADEECDRGGLAGAGAGHDPHRLQRGGEDRLLLQAGLDPEESASGHAKASLPSGQAGQTWRNGQRSQCAPTRGSQFSARIWREISTSVWRTLSRLAMSKG